MPGLATRAGETIVEVRLLGPFELVLDDEVVPVRGRSERALLALLATAPGRVFTKDQLIDALWGDEPPANPDNALQLRVSKLRKAVGEVLVTVASGYRLDIDDGDVDMIRFADLIRQRRFDAALQLWRGDPLAEFADHNWAAAEGTRLRELHATAIEGRVDERLSTGDHTALVAELEGLVAAEPLRERLRAQQMVALYRTGRTPDALAVFQSFRDLLNDELGVEPSADLRALEMRILREDPSLGAQSHVASVGNVPTLRNPLLGRQREVDRLLELLESTSLVTLTGPGGVGKTTLALAAATQFIDRFTDGAWFVPLAHVDDPRRVADAVAQALPVADPDRGSATQLVTAWLGSRRALLVLDNCEHLADACATFVDDLLSASGPSPRVLATSREALAVTGEVQLPVSPLALSDAVGLFIDRAHQISSDAALSPDDASVQKICDQLDGIPLAVELAAARIKMLSAEQIAARLDGRFQLLTVAPRTADARHQTLRATVDWSHDLLSASQQALFRRLAIFRGGWTLAAAEAVCDLEGSGDVLDRLGDLVDRSMAVTADGRFRMLETIRAYASEHLTYSGEQEDVARRHAEFFTRFAEEVEPRLRGPAQRTWLPRLQQEDTNLRAAMTWATDNLDTDPEVALRLGGALGWYWYVGRQTEGVAFLRTSLGAGGGADLARARALQALSVAVRPVGCIVHPSSEGANAAEQSAALFRKRHDPVGTAVSELLAAVEGVSHADPAPALERVERARADLRANGDAWGAALADFVEMEIRLHHGELDESLRLGRHAQRAFDLLDDDWGRSAVMLHLGYGLRVAGRLDDAGEVLTDAVELSRAGELPNNLARAACELAEAALDRGEADGARPWVDECERTAEELGNDTLMAMAHHARAGMHRLRGEPTEAARQYRNALDRAQGSDFVKGLARAFLGLTASYLDVGDLEAARNELSAAEREMGRLADAGVAAVAIEQRARLAAATGDEAERDRLLEEAEALRISRHRPAGALDRMTVTSRPR